MVRQTVRCFKAAISRLSQPSASMVMNSRYGKETNNGLNGRERRKTAYMHRGKLERNDDIDEDHLGNLSRWKANFLVFFVVIFLYFLLVSCEAGKFLVLVIILVEWTWTRNMYSCFGLLAYVGKSKRRKSKQVGVYNEKVIYRWWKSPFHNINPNFLWILLISS